MFRKLVYKLGTKYRNPSMSACFNELRSTQFASSEELRKLQDEKLSELAAFCYLNSPFYQEHFKAIGINPCNEPFLRKHLVKLPILKKDSLIKFNNDIHTVNTFTFDKLFLAETSGSTGQALTFYKDERWDSYNRSSINRGLAWFNVAPWEKNGYFWGFNFNFLRKLKTIFLDLLMNRFRLFSYSQIELNTFLNKCKRAKYLEGYSSMIYETAKLANELGVKLDNISVIKGTSEKIYPHYHTETLKAFGCKMISEYGSAESGIIAFECPNGKMHINEETCIIEEVGGKAIVTNLVARSFPTIRYDLGDYIKLSDKKCSCGRSHQVLEEVTGRVGKNIIGEDGQKYPSLTLYYVFKNIAVVHGLELTYRCEQSSVGLLDVYIEVVIDKKLEEILNREFSKYFKSNVICNYMYVKSVRVKGKKLKDFESKLFNDQ